MFRKGFYWDKDGEGGGEGKKGTPQEPPAEDKKDMVPRSRLNDKIKEAKDWKQKFEDLAKEKADAEKEKKEKQGEWQELATKAETEASKATAKALRLEVALEKGLPADLVDRLKGDTREDLEADADSLLELLGKPPGPGNPPKGKGGKPQKVDLSDLTPEQIRKNSDKIMQATREQLGS